MRSTYTIIAIAILPLLFISCHSNSQPVAKKIDYSKFHDTAVKSAAAALVYDTNNEKVRTITAQLDQYYKRQVAAGFNGGVLIGYGGKVIYERYFGLSNKEKKIPFGQNSSSQLASVSKTFAGAALLYLYQRKYVNIDLPVQTYLKQFPYPNITVKMLLDHRSGIPDYTKWVPEYTGDMKNPITNEQMLTLLSTRKPTLEFTPNKHFKYCNTNFALIAMIIEKVTEMNYYDFMSKYIFQPLGMTSSFVYSPWKGLPANATISYKYNWRREPDMFADGVYGDKGIYSTVEDMYRWDQSFYHNLLLSNETLELAYGPCSFEKPGIKNYGLGWRMLCYPNGNKIIYHNGWWHGNNTSFYRFIKEDMTIIVLGNKFTNSIYHQAPAVYSIIKGQPVQKGFDTED